MGFISLPGDKSPWVRPAAHSAGWGGVGSVGGLTSSASGLPLFFIPAGFSPAGALCCLPATARGAKAGAKLCPPSLFFLAVPG